MQIKPKPRILLATAFSLALHGGSIAAVGIIHNKNQKKTEVAALVESKPKELPPKEPSPIVLPSPVPENRCSIDQVQLERSKVEKQAFIRQLVADLKRGKPPLLSDFMLKSELLDQKIEDLAECSSEPIDEAKTIAKYKKIMGAAKKEADSYDKIAAKLEALHQFSTHRQFRGYLKGSRRLIEVVHKGTYNCVSSTAFLSSLESELIGSNHFGVILLDPSKDPSKGKTGHMLSWFENQEGTWQIENTDGKPPVIKPYVKGLRAPKEIFIAAYLVRNGIGVEKLPKNLARYYAKGVGSDGFPIAGVSSDIPDPPDYFIPNPYYQAETAEVIKDAQTIAALLSFFKKGERSAADTLSVSITRIPDGIDWCELAQVNHDKDPLFAKTRINMSRRITGSHPHPNPNFLYAGSVNMARILAASGSDSKELNKCSPEKEFERFKSYAESILSGRKNVAGRNAAFMSALALPEEGRRLLLKIYAAKELDADIRARAVINIYLSYSPENFDWFKTEFENMNAKYRGAHKPIPSPDGTVLAYATFALGEAPPQRTKEAFGILYRAFEGEKHPTRRWSLMGSIAKLGYGMIALEYCDKMDKDFEIDNLKKYFSENDFWYYNKENTDSFKDYVIKNIITLFPDRPPSPEEIDKLKSWIGREANPEIRADLIAILANSGKADEAIKDAENAILPLLLGDLKDKAMAEELVLSLGKIDHPKIKDMLLRVFDKHPELAPEIGDVFIRRGFQSDKLIKELKNRLDNTKGDSWQRTYAALLLILMGEM